MEQVNHSVCKTDATGALPVGTSNFHSIQAEIALRSVGNGQKAGASPAGGSALSQRRQVASHLAHNQKAVGSIPAAATTCAYSVTYHHRNSRLAFQGPRRS